jgi:hypothetical protein
LFSNDDVIDTFFKWKPPIFFLDSDSPFNCLNDSIKILLPYIRKFLRKKNNKVGENKFYNVSLELLPIKSRARYGKEYNALLRRRQVVRSASLASTSSSAPTRYLEKKSGTFGVLIRVKNCTFNFYNTDKKVKYLCKC